MGTHCSPCCWFHGWPWPCSSAAAGRRMSGGEDEASAAKAEPAEPRSAAVAPA